MEFNEETIDKIVESYKESIRVQRAVVAVCEEWQMLSEMAEHLAERGDFVKSDEIDDKRIAIEEKLESEYGIEIDSFGAVLSHN